MILVVSILNPSFFMWWYIGTLLILFVFHLVSGLLLPVVCFLSIPFVYGLRGLTHWMIRSTAGWSLGGSDGLYILMNDFGFYTRNFLYYIYIYIYFPMLKWNSFSWCQVIFWEFILIYAWDSFFIFPPKFSFEWNVVV